MPKVLRILNRFNLGGPTYNASYLTKYLSPEFETILVGGRKEETEASSEFIPQNLGLKPIIIDELHRSINPYYDSVAYQKIKQIIKDFKPDIVHTHASKAGTLGRMAAYFSDVPVIVHTFHGHVFDAYFGSIQSNIYKTIEKRMAKFSSRIIAVSDKQKYELAEVHHICDADKIDVIQLGFDLDKYQIDMDAKRAKFRSDNFISDDEIAIGLIGRIVPIKNHSMFIMALKKVIDKTNRKVKAFIVGDGEDKIKVMNLCSDLNIDFADYTVEKKNATVTFTSWLTDIDCVNAGMDIIALSSLNEGTPVSLIEAQASCKPIITTNVGGISNIVIPDQTALLSENDNKEEFAQNLLKLVEDEQLRNKLSISGYNFVKDKFSYQRLVKDMSQLYYRLLSEAK